MDSRFTPTQAAHCALTRGSPWPKVRIEIISYSHNSIQFIVCESNQNQLWLLGGLKRWSSAMPLNETGLTKPLIVLNLRSRKCLLLVYSIVHHNKSTQPIHLRCHISKGHYYPEQVYCLPATPSGQHV